ncbi:MAG: hypothetical protein R3B13_17590 [Polyangiaceae bacterium]
MFLRLRSLALRFAAVGTVTIAAPSQAAAAPPTPTEHAASVPDTSRGFALRLGLSEDAAIIGGSDVCSRQSQLESGFACFRESGSQYHGTPLPGRANKINDGLSPAATRVLLGLDWSLVAWFAAGLEGGVVFIGGSPRPDGGRRSLPIHLAGRALIYPAGDAQVANALAFYGLLQFGIREVDGKQSVTVFEDPAALPPPNQPDNPPTQTLDAYQRMGSGFFGLGGGLHAPLGSGFGVGAELSLLRMFPTSGTGLSLSAALEYEL